MIRPLTRPPLRRTGLPGLAHVLRTHRLPSPADLREWHEEAIYAVALDEAKAADDFRRTAEYNDD